MLVEPQQGLSGASEFFDFVENERDRFLNAPIRIFFEPVADFYVADWCDSAEVVLPDWATLAIRGRYGGAVQFNRL
jgi:hypothetical protein